MRFIPRKRHTLGPNCCDAIEGFGAAMNMHDHYAQSGNTTEAEKWFAHAQRLAKAYRNEHNQGGE
jgi:hypothetical protein